jgi:phage-related protein
MGFIGLSPYGATPPGEIDPGEGLASIPGLEAKLEYNGLLLNNIADVDKFRVMSIDGLADADLRDSRAVNPGRHGETAFQAFYGGRTLVLNGRIEAHTLNKLRDMQYDLRLAFNELEEKPLIFHSYLGSAYDRVIYCRKGASLTMGEKQDDWRFFRDFQITLRASNPRFLTYNQKAATWTATASTASFQFMFNVINSGTFDAEPKIVITGPVINPQITNHTTDETLVLNTTLTSAESVIVDVEKRVMTDNYGNVIRSHINAISRWPSIAPGSNYFEISATGLTSGVSSVSVLWHDTWL